MIIYTIKTTDCLQAILNCVSIAKAQFWMSSIIEESKLTSVLSKMIEKYDLHQTDQARRTKLRKGQPVWSLVLHYEVAEKGVRFWLFCTGFRNNQRSKKDCTDQIKALNEQLKKTEHLKCVMTENLDELIRFKNYVLGQYMVYDGLQAGINKQYFSPYKFGLIDQNVAMNQATINLSFRSIDDVDPQRGKLDSIQRNFGFLFYEAQQRPQYLGLKKTDVIAQLRKIYGVTVDETASYNMLMQQLFKYHRRISQRYLDSVQSNVEKKVTLTWYFDQYYLNQFSHELRAKLKDIPTRRYLFEDSMKRLYAKANFHGVRHQIGEINSRVRRLVQNNYPDFYDKIEWPKNLHYVRFSPKKYENLEQFHADCMQLNALEKY